MGCGDWTRLLLMLYNQTDISMNTSDHHAFLFYSLPSSICCVHSCLVWNDGAVVICWWDNGSTGMVRKAEGV